MASGKNVVFGLIGIAMIVIIGAVLAVTVFGRHQSTNSNQVRVVAAENFWGDVTRQIGGDHVQVTSIITDPSADPHLYESDARDSAALSAADVVIENGLGYDDFMDKLLAAVPNHSRAVLNVADVLKVTGDGANPHLWYDTPRVPTVARAIADQLEAKDPGDKATFERNLQRFDDSLKPTLDVISKIRAKYPNAPVAYTERVPEYLLQAAGLAVKTPPGFASAIEDGNDPSPADTVAMQDLITGRKIKVLLYNSQAASPVTQHVRDLAHQAGIPVIGVTETLPQNEKDFQSWQLDQARALLQALGG